MEDNQISNEKLSAEKMISEFIDQPLYATVLTPIIKLMASTATMFLCGGAVRDVLLGKVPKDLDILVPRSQFDKILGYYKDIVDCTDDSLPIKVVHFNSHVLMAKAAKGQKLLRVILEVTCPDMDKATIELDIKELDINEQNYDEILQRDRNFRDFTANALQFDILTRRVFDTIRETTKDSGLTDIKNLILTPMNEPTSIFQDRRRIIRAVRLSNQHGLKYSDSLYKILIEGASNLLQTHKHHNQLIMDYNKCISDVNNCPMIFHHLFKWHLIHKFPQGEVSADLISQSIDILNDQTLCNSDDKFDQVLTRYKNLKAAIAVSLSLLSVAYPGDSLTVLSETTSKLQHILTTVMCAPKEHSATAAQFFSLIIKALVEETSKDHPKLKKLMTHLKIPQPQVKASTLYDALLLKPADAATKPTTDTVVVNLPLNGAGVAADVYGTLDIYGGMPATDGVATDGLNQKDNDVDKFLWSGVDDCSDEAIELNLKDLDFDDDIESDDEYA